jgi:hypothetical protein
MFFFKKTFHKKLKSTKNLIVKAIRIFGGDKKVSQRTKHLSDKKITSLAVLILGFFTIGVALVAGIQILKNNYYGSFAASGSIEFVQTKLARSESTVNPSIAVKASQTNTTNVTVNYSVTGGTAVSGVDFTGNTNGIITIVAGETQTVLPLVIINNTTAQANKSIQVTLSSPIAGMTLGSNTVHTYTILDDDQESNLQTYDAETLPVTSGLSLRLDASNVSTTGVNVTNWIDQSGGNNSAVQTTSANQPTLVNNAINGKPAIRFDGANDSLVTTNNIIPANSNYTVVAIDKRNAAPTGIWPIVANVTEFNPNKNFSLIYRNNTTASLSQFSNDLDATVEGYIPGNAALSVGTFDSTIGHKLFRNGLQIASNTITTGLSTTDKIGIGVWNNSSYYNGDIGEILIYNRALSSAEIKQVECYMAAKYGTGAVGCNAKLKLYFDASSGTGQTTNGVAVSSWEDKSGNGNNAVQTITANQPTFQTAGINGKPSVRFNGGSGTIATQNNVTLNNSFTHYVVSKVTANGILLEHTSNLNNNSDGSYIYSSTGESFEVKRAGLLSGKNIGTNWASTGAPQIINQTFGGTNTDHNLYINGSVQTNTVAFAQLGTGGVASAPIYIGGRGTGSSTITGDISEVITLGNNASSAQRNIIDNYLSAKYGIAISNSKYALGTGANNKLIGIGSELDLNINRSGGSQGLSISDTANTLDAGEYVLAAHDGGTATVSTSDLPNGVSARWNRVWGIDKTATNGVDAALSFDFSQYSNGIPGMTTNYKLLYRSGATGGFSQVTTTGTNIINSDQISFTVSDSNLLDGYYTLGTTDTINSSLTTLDVPTGLTVTKQNDETSASVSWNAVNGATSYLLEYSNDGFAGNLVSTNFAGLSTTITNLVNGPEYSFRVSAFGNSQNSVTSTKQVINFAPKITSISPNTGASIGGYDAVISGTNLGSPEYTKAVTINNSNSTINNFEGNITVDTASLISANKLKADCSDIRIKDLNLGTDLNYWIDGDCNTPNTSIWFKKPFLASGSSNIYLTYGNSTRSSQSNILNFSFGTLLGGPNNKLWLSANSGTSSTTDGANISNWNDRSGNGNNATQSTIANQPILKNNIQNGQPVIRFDGANDFLNNTTANISSSQRSLIFVAKANTTQAKTIFNFKRTTPVRSFGVGQSGGIYYISSDGVNNASNYTTGNTDNITQSPFLGIFLQNGIGLGSLSYYLNSNQQSLNGSQLTNDSGASGFTVAYREDYPAGGYFSGDMSEIIVTDKVLTNDERQALETYLNTKYKLYNTNSNLNISLGSENAKAVINFDTNTAPGDSLVKGKSVSIKVPAHPAGVVSVTYQNPDNQTATLTNGFTYAVPTITSVSPNSSAGVGGDTVTITGTNFSLGAFKKAITITNPTASTITNYEGSLSVDTASLISSGKLRSDCGDIRVKDSDNTTDLNYWIDGDCNSSSTLVWFKKPTLSTGTSIVYLKYGVPALTSQSSITNFSFSSLLTGTSNKLWVSANKGIDTTVDGNPISTWNDRTANSNNIAQSVAANKPILKNNILNSRPVVRFDGVNDFIDRTGQIASNNFTAFYVAKPNVSFPIPGESPSGSDTSIKNYLSFPLNTLNTESGSGIAFGTNGISVQEHAPGYLPSLAATTSNNGNNFSSLSYSYTNKTARIDLNGQTVRNGLTSTRTNVYAPKSFGGGTYGYFNGDLAEVIVFDTSLSITDRQIAEKYLNTKYRLYNTNLLPALNISTEGPDFSILFDTSQATDLVLVNTTTITAKVPAHPNGPVNIQFSNLAGDTATLANGFTYLAPNITSVSPNNGTIGGGNTVTVTGTNFASIGYRAVVNITNPSGAIISNYEGNVKLDTKSLISAGKLKNDCGDLRFKDSDGATDLSYYIESDTCNSPDTLIWFKKPSLAVDTSQIFILYGNTSLASQSNISSFSFGNALGSTNNKIWLSAGSVSDLSTESAPTFDNLVGVTVVGDKVSRNTAPLGWNAGFTSTNSLTKGKGYVSTKIPIVNTLHGMIGLSNGNTDSNYTDIDFAIYAFLGTLQVYESGLPKGGFGTYQTGDTLSVELLNNKIIYKKNGSVFYTSLVTPTTSNLIIDGSMYENTGGFEEIRFCDGTCNGSSLPSWNDRTANANNATQVTPSSSPTYFRNQLNGQPVLRFDGINDGLSAPLPLSGATNFSIFSVTNHLAFNSGGNAAISWGTNSTSGFYQQSYYYTPQTGTKFGAGWLNGGGNSLSIQDASTGQAKLISSVYNGTSHIMRLNNQDGTTGTKSDSNFVGGTFDLGFPAIVGGSTNYFNGDIAEIILFDSALNSTDRTAIENYLNTKYRLFNANALPSSTVGNESSNIDILFGTKLATNVTLVNSTTITAVAPANTSGSVNVVFRNTNGDIATLTNGYSYAGPIITSVTPASGPTAGSSEVVINGNYFDFTDGNKYRREIVINSSDPANIANYQVSLNVDTAALISQGKMRSDCGDVRFNDGQTVLGYWLESGCNTANTKIWVKIPNLISGQNKVYISYGTSTFTTASSPDSVFIRRIPGLVSAYTMDGNIANTADDTQNLNNVTGVNNAVAQGKFGNARLFNGSNSYFSKTAVSLPTGNKMSVVAWIKPSGYGDATYNGIANWGSRACTATTFLMSIQNTGRPSMATYCNDYVPTTGAAATLGAWNHQAVTLDENNVSLYMNNSVSTGTLAVTPNVQSTNFSIGSTDLPGRLFNGAIDELQIYNRALTAPEISDLYSNYGYSSTSTGGETLVTKYTPNGITSTVLGESTQPAVSINNLPVLSAQYISPTQIKIMTPPNPLGTYGVKVTGLDGSSSNTNINYSYVAPTVTAVTPNAGPNSGGSQVTVAGTGFQSLGYGSIPLNISNTNSTALTDYQTKFTLDTATLISSGKMASDCANLRVKDAGNIDLPYWIESGCNTNTTVIWTKIPSIAANGSVNINIFYGQTGLSSASNGNNVFDLFDDFDGTTIDTSKWDKVGNTWTVSGGQLVLPNTGTSGVLYSNLISKTFTSSNAIIETINTPLSVGSSQGKGLLFRYVDINNNYAGSMEAYNTNITELVRRVGGTFANISATPTNGGVVANSRYRQVVSYNGSSLSNSVTKLDTNQTTLTTASDTTFTNGKVGFVVERDETNTGAKFDFILVRKFAAVQPVLSFGVESKVINLAFGSNNVIGNLINPQTITAFTPAGTGNVNVTVTNSDGATATGAGLYTYGTFITPNTINNLQATTNTGDVALTWTAPNSNGSPISDYIIKYSQDNFATEIVYNDGVGSGTSTVVTGLTPGQNYKFKVIAVNGIGNSLDSNIVSVIKLDCDTDLGGADLIISTNQVLTGRYCNINLFQVNSGITATLNNTPGTGSTGGKIVKINAQNANILGTINATATGYLGALQSPNSSSIAQGPGAPPNSNSCYSAGAGGSYGGKGGQYSLASANVYGSITQPTDLGSGGTAGCSQPGGNGGGAIKLTVAGTLTNNGSILANGGAGTGYGSGGSGGSIWLQTSTLAGSGIISANGGDRGGNATTINPGGGGGRVSLNYNTNTYSGTTTVFGGIGGFQYGGAGTIFDRDTDDTLNPNGSLIISNGARPTGANSPLSDNGNQYTFDNLTIQNALVDYTKVNNTLSVTNTLSLQSSASTPDTSRLSTLILSGQDTYNFGNLIIKANGALSQAANNITQQNSILVSSTSIDVQTGGTINATATGYLGALQSPNSSSIAQGPGAPPNSNSCYSAGAGGSYGGKGGQYSLASANVYGSITQPTDLGSGGTAGCSQPGGNGGGAIKLTVAGTLTNNGSILANGGAGTGYGSGGSGGSIWLQTSTLAGSGIISANGGDRGGNATTINPGGGGGRVALYYQNSTSTMTAGTPTSSIAVNGGIGGGDCVEVLTGTNPAAYANTTSGCTGTIYDPNTPEINLTSSIVNTNPNPPSIGSVFSLGVTSVKNTLGSNLLAATCSVSITGPGVYATPVVRTGIVVSGTCTLSANFPAPDTIGTHTAVITVTSNTNAQTTTRTLGVFITSANKAKEDPANLGQPLKTTFVETPNPTIIGQVNPTFSVTGLMDNDNNQALNGIPCTFVIAGPNSFTQTYISPNTIGGSCSLTILTALPNVAGMYTATVSIQGGTQVLTSTPISFDRFFDIYLQSNKIPGNTTVNSSPIIYAATPNPTFTSPVLKKYDNSSNVASSTICKIIIQIDSNPIQQYASTTNTNGQCVATVPNANLYAGVLKVKTVVTIQGSDFETNFSTISTAGFPSYKAKESSTSAGQPIYSSQFVTPSPAFAGESLILTTSGLLDSANGNVLSQAVCTFTVTGPNGYSQTFNTTTASNGNCSVTLSAAQVPKITGNYSFSLSIVGENGTLVTPNFAFNQIMNIYTVSNLIPGASTISPNPINVGQNLTITSAIIRKNNNSSVIASGTTCKNIIQVNLLAPVESAGMTNGSGQCVTTIPGSSITASGNASIKTIVSLLGNDYNPDYTFQTGLAVFNVSFPPTSQICANATFRDDNKNGIQDGAEPLLAGVTIQLRNSSTNALINSLVTTITGPNCFGSLYDGTYKLEGVTPAGSVKTLPASSTSYTVSVGVGAIENRSFGYNGDQQICPNPTFRDINENGVFNSGDTAINGVTTNLYLASDLNTLLETIVTNSVLCFAPRSPGNYVVEQINPPNSVPTSTGTITTTKIQRPVTHAFAVQSNVNFAYKLIATSKAKPQASPNNNKPVNGGTIVNTSLTVYKNKNFIADTSGLVDTGTLSPLTGIPCTMIFSGPSFNSPITKAGVVTNGVCHVDPVPDNAATGNQVVTQVAGESGTLQTDPTSFDVLAGLATICPTPYKDYNKNGTKDTTEPYYGGITSELYSGTTLLQTITSNTIGNVCFTPVDHSFAYTIKQTIPTSAVLTTTGYTIVGNLAQTTVTPDPASTVNKLFGYKGTGSVCPNSTFRDDNGNGSKDGAEININGYTATLLDDNNVTVGSFAIDNSACFTDVLSGNLTLKVDPGTLLINNTTGGNTKSISLTNGQNVIYNFGYQNNAKICALPYNDYNKNQLKETTESYITGLSTQLVRVSDSQVIQTINSTGSTTCFSPVVPDNYQIRQTPTAGYEHLVSNLPVSPVLINVTSLLGVTNTSDVDYSGTSSICFAAYQDINFNGVRDSGEAIINGATATLRDSLGSIISSVTLSSEPTACFSVFATPQQYRIDVAQPSDTVSSTGGNSQLFSVSAGATVTRLFGYDGRPTICPEVFRDDNSNSIKDSGEPRISGATITLKDSTNTTSLGSFVSSGAVQCFGPVTIGSYHVVSSGIPTFGATTSEDQVVTLQFATPSLPKFGYNGNGLICVNQTFRDDNQNGQFDLGEQAYQGLNTFLSLSSSNTPLQTVPTNAGGLACFAPVPPGTYVVSQALPLGGISTTGGSQTIVLPSGGTRNTSFGYTGSGVICPNPTFNDSNYDGVKQESENLIAGVVTNLYISTNLVTPIATLSTDAIGTNCFRNLFNASYVVTQTAPSGYGITTSTGSSQTVVLNTGDLKSTGFGYTNNPDFLLASIRGFLYVDRNENGAYNRYGDDTLEVTVFDNDVPVTQQTVVLQKFNSVSNDYEDVFSQITGTDGKYAFNSLSPGNYKILIRTILGLRAVQPTPAEKLITISSTEKSFNNDFSFQYTAKICPQLYIDKNNNGTFDGTDFDILATEGRYYQLLYTSFNGTQTASNGNTAGWFIKTGGGNACIENVPPRDYTLILRGPNQGGNFSNVDLGFYNILTPNNTFTVFLASEIQPSNRYYSNFQVNNATSTIKGRVWNNKQGSSNGYDPDGNDNQTGISNGRNYDFDNDTAYVGVSLQLIKCSDGFEDTIPTATWNLNPPTITTASDGTYTFSNIVPGRYYVRRNTGFANESILNISSGGGLLQAPCNGSNNFNFFNYYTPPTSGAITPGSTVGFDITTSYQGAIGVGLYFDYYDDLQKNGWESGCFDANCSNFLKAIFTLKDAISGDVLLVYNSYTNGLSFGTLQPGDYIVEVASLNTTNAPITTNELIKTTSIATTETDSLSFGFTTPDTTTISGKVFIDRGRDGAYLVNGSDTLAATTYDNDVTLQSYVVEVYYGGPSNGVLLATLQTDADGNFAVPGLLSSQGVYTIVVVTSAPTNTACISCSRSIYAGLNGNYNTNLTYDFDGSMLLRGFLDTSANGVRNGDELDASGVTYKVTSSDGYVVGNNIPITSSGDPQLKQMVPGSYNVEVVNTPVGITLTGGYTSPANYSVSGVSNTALDYPFTPYTNNSITGRVFVDKGSLNNIFNINGEDNDASQVFDNETVLANATVRISGPAGIISTTTDANGFYTISNIPSGKYYFFKDPASYPGITNSEWNVDISGPLSTSVSSECATLIYCRRYQGGSGFGATITFGSNNNFTNDYTFIYTNSITSRFLDDKNGDGIVTFYPSSGYTESVIGGTAFELELPSGQILPCSGQYIVLGKCDWKGLAPGNYKVKKTANLANKISTNATKSLDSGLTIGLANFGNVDNISTSLNQSSINQRQYFTFFQFTPVVTNNASIIGRAFVDRNSNLVYQSSGADGNATTVEDNDIPLQSIPIRLTGTSTSGAAIDIPIITGGDGRYQITDLPGGTFQIKAGNP